jgi:hypothetical protein
MMANVIIIKTQCLYWKRKRKTMGLVYAAVISVYLWDRSNTLPAEF